MFGWAVRYYFHLPLRYYFAHQMRILQETSSLSNFLFVKGRKIFLAPFGLVARINLIVAGPRIYLFWSFLLS